MQRYQEQQSNYEVDKTDFPIAMAYVPWQKNATVFEDFEKGYHCGTIFPELVLPFKGRRS